MKWILNSILLIYTFQYPCYASMKHYDGIFNRTIIQPFKQIMKESMTDGLPYNICYCFGSKCLHCPTGTFCNYDRSGCCPEPQCQSKDGKHCECTAITMKDKNNEVEQSVYYKTSPNSDTGHINSTFTAIQDDIDYFQSICTIFAKETRNQNPNPNISQFAAMTLNKASNEPYSTNKYDPDPIVFQLNHQVHNYDSAPPLKQGFTTEHAERRVLGNLGQMLLWFKSNREQSQPRPPSVYLLTYLSPCGDCINDIVNHKSKHQHQLTEVYVAWHRTYYLMKQNIFLQGLETFLEKGITVVYNLKGLCFDPKSKKGPPLVQPTLFDLLLKKYGKSQYCKNKDELRKSLARLVNYLVWECKNVFDIDGHETTKKYVINCLQDKINQLHPRVHSKMQLQKEIKKAMNTIWEINTPFLMSPPLSPNDPTAISNDINDLRGKITNNLCFQEKKNHNW